MENIGKTINDFYCNGFFGRVYDLTGSIIIGEGPEWIVIKKQNGTISFADFQQFNNKQEYIDKWCSDEQFVE